MKGFKMFKDKLTNNKFIVPLLINLTFLFLALLFCDMKYEVSDDFIMVRYYPELLDIITTNTYFSLTSYMVTFLSFYIPLPKK